ncbi:DUF1588 domain-containing protein [Pseudobacteriovorax antillogorgiicola]|uniref:DUF1588 domain-containing protein n=1 Tax=Pseudobacteriovorax antillogorgiicola TaxID=1513793 RepID=A0A1Y6CN24_9BACT|nr:DUF1588 domain-containing protein [Pseudobacteriovorax antillogorgiicola]TCS45189.1 uncharacterized protein DUF1587 [Pseudobacteriovorax antillogorgiicola]SMF75640.1 Protein of unknown function [Pseudobacteriovorax antillogorgiicola]
MTDLLKKIFINVARLALPYALMQSMASCMLEPSVDRDEDYAHVLPTRRLSKAEYVNSIKYIFNIGDTDIGPELKILLLSVPEDHVYKGFSNLKETLSANHLFGYMRVAHYITDQLEKKGFFEDEFPCLKSTNQNWACIEEAVNILGFQILRRPIETREVSKFLNVASPASSNAEIVANATQLMLQSPDFLYKISYVEEHSTKKSLFLLDSYSFASNFSYFLQGLPPDRTLLQDVRDGQFSLDNRSHHFERIWESKHAQSHWNRFFIEWLELESFPALAYSEEIEIDLKNLQEVSTLELQNMSKTIFMKNGSIHDLFLSKQEFYEHPLLREIYKQEGKFLRNRPGVFTRARMLATGNDRDISRPIKRAALIVDKALCLDLGRPDPNNLPNDALKIPEVDETTTTRNKWEEKTSDSSCQKCHSILNPIGFTFENYDGAGQFVDNEIIFDRRPKKVNILPIDSFVEFTYQETSYVADKPEDIFTIFLERGMIQTCLAKQIISYGKKIDNPSNLEVHYLASLFDTMSIKEAIKKYLISDSFRTVEGEVYGIK